MIASRGSARQVCCILALVLPFGLSGDGRTLAAPDSGSTARSAVGARIETDSLSTVGIDTAGTLTAADGALPVDMWRDTPRSLVDALLPRLPVGSPSPTIRRLLRRLLLTAAAVPRGDGEPGQLLDDRIWMLWRTGDTAGLRDLIGAVPAESRSARMWRLDTEARLLDGDTTAACQTAESQIDVDTDLFWQQVLGFCQALVGNADGASLTVALLAERSDHGIQPYKALIEALNSDRGSGPKITDPSPLELAMMRAAGVQPSPDAAASDDLPMLVAIARAGTFNEPLRLAAAERAVSAGLLPAQDIYTLYARLRPEKLGAGARGGGRAGQGSAGISVLMREAAGGTGDRLVQAVRILDVGRQNGDWLQVTSLVLPWLQAAEPSTASPRLAEAVVPALLAQGDRQRAQSWLDRLADAAAAGDPDAAAVVRELMPLVRLAQLRQAPGGDAEWLADWLQAAGSQPDMTTGDERLLAMLQATGEAVPDRLWQRLLQGPAQMSATNIGQAFRTELARASQGGRVGETVLLALVGLGVDGPQVLSTASMEAAVESLRAVGLEVDARALAIEAVASR